MPERCRQAKECEYFNETLRELLFKSHRTIFRIEEAAKVVRVLHVRHASQRTIGEPDEEEGGGR